MVATDIKIITHLLEFKFLAKTSRDELRTKETNFIILTDEDGNKGIGEASIIPGLSLENPVEFMAKLNSLSVHSIDNFHEELKDFPAIRFGLETALLDLKTGSQRELYATEFTLNNAPIPINGLVWMGSEDFMRSQISEKIDSGFKFPE